MEVIALIFVLYIQAFSKQTYCMGHQIRGWLKKDDKWTENGAKRTESRDLNFFH